MNTENRSSFPVVSLRSTTGQWLALDAKSGRGPVTLFIAYATSVGGAEYYVTTTSVNGSKKTCRAK